MNIVSEKKLIELDLVGRSFSYGGRGPDKFDCYGLVMHLYEHIDGIIIPDYTTPSTAKEIMTLMYTELSNKWVRSESGRMIYIRLNGNSHVGYDLGDGRFIHVWERSGGVRIESKHDWQSRIITNYALNK